MLKAVIFDIDDTLYSFRDAHDHAMPIVSDFARRELGLERDVFFTAYNETMEEQFRDHGDVAGCHSRAVRFQLMMEKLHLPIRFAPVLNDLYWNTLLSIMEPFPGVPELIRDLKSRGIRLGVGTNMTADWQIRKLEQLGLIDSMDFVVSSEEAGVEKPEAGLFRLCAEKAGCAPSECLFIGDNLEKDVQGALSAGMDALWYQPDSARAAQYPSVKSIPTFKGLIII